MPSINFDIPNTLLESLKSYLAQHKLQSADHVICDALKMYLEANANVLFQISTANALVEGIYRGAVSVGSLLEHGDLGLGTFENLDGEMIIVDGEVFQARSDGSVQKVTGDVMTPFAVVTRFMPTEIVASADCASYDALEKQFDRLRDSDNLFYALRVSGQFRQVHVRAMCKTSEGVPLVQAAAVQPEFHYEKMEGTLVGFWSPQLARGLNVPGYHFHFLSKQHEKGGHVLGCAGKNLRLEIQREIGFTTVLPDNDRFLHADLGGNHDDELRRAESSREE